MPAVYTQYASLPGCPQLLPTQPIATRAPAPGLNHGPLLLLLLPALPGYLTKTDCINSAPAPGLYRDPLLLLNRSSSLAHLA
jgi:hypothetical protein